MGNKIMRHFLSTLIIAATALGTSVFAQAAETPRQKLDEMAATLAANLARVCPQSAYGDAAAFKTCSTALSQATFLPLTDAILWGGDQASQPIKKRHLTHFNTAVFRSMYLPLMTFTGKWTLGHDDRENLDIVRVEAFFRNDLAAGEYPYPFWHSADKWNAYETMNQVNFYLNADGKIFVVTRGDAGSNAGKGTYTHVAHEPFQKGQWQWTDESGKPQPEVTLFSARYQTSNPHTQRLDQTYRAFASEMRAASCDGCHNPSNPAHSDALTLLQTPAHAAGEIDRVIKEVQEGTMPQDELGLRKDIDPTLRAAILRTAQAFRNELAFADDWEAQTRVSSPVAYSTERNEVRTR
jgi:hypothetical protein